MIKISTEGVLARIKQGGSHTAKSLAAECGARPENMAVALRKLYDAGHLRREKHKDEPGRAGRPAFRYTAA